MEPPFLSIVITILNASQTIKACLNSIQDQTFADFELIIVDGGSSDGTLDIISQYKFPAFKLQVVPSISLYAGLNLGISLSQGEWLYFIGADDALFEPDTLQRVATAIGQKQPHTRVMVGSVELTKRKILHTPELGHLRFLLYRVHHQGMFYHHTVFAQARFDETMQVAADYKFNVKLVLSQIAHETMDLIVCRFGEDGISNRLRKIGLYEMQLTHSQLFNGIEQAWILFYFSIRSGLGYWLRAKGWYRTLSTIKKIVG